MQASILLTISLCLAVGSLAQRPEPCRPPRAMEGIQRVMMPKEGYSAFEKFAIDGEREYRLTLETLDDHSIVIETLHLFNEGVYYEIDRKTKTCRGRLISANHFRLGAGVPYSATFHSQAIIGTSSAPGEGLLVNNWVGKLPEYRSNYFMTFTDKGCIPVYIWFEGDIFNSFYDIELRVENPDVFIPPYYCY